MKVLYSCLSRSWGGMEMYTLTLVEQLTKQGIHTELLCYCNSKLHLTASEQNIIINPIKAAGYFNPIQIIKLLRLLKRGEFSLIHSQASKDLWILVPALKLLNSKIPLFFTKHLASFVVKKDIMHKFLYKRITKAFAISKMIKKNLEETTCLIAENIILLHDGIDVNKFNPDTANRSKIRREFNISENDITIGMLARMTPGKGHEEFLGAAKELIKKYGNLKFLVVGKASRGEEGYESKVKKIAQNYNLKNYLIFTGFRTDIPDLLSAMDVFAFPSHAEAFGIALIEAMALKKPTVCANGSGVLDIAVDGKTSYLFEPKNGEDLKQKLEKLIISEETREHFGNNARIRVVENFDIEKLTEKTIKYYSQET